jgi:hypothetical protein
MSALSKDEDEVVVMDCARSLVPEPEGVLCGC